MLWRSLKGRGLLLNFHACRESFTLNLGASLYERRRRNSQWSCRALLWLFTVEFYCVCITRYWGKCQWFLLLIFFLSHWHFSKKISANYFQLKSLWIRSLYSLRCFSTSQITSNKNSMGRENVCVPRSIIILISFHDETENKQILYICFLESDFPTHK